MLCCRGHGSMFRFNAASSKMISLADWRAEKSSTLKRCGRRSGSNEVFIHCCQLSATGPSTCHEIARAASKSGLHRWTTLLSSLMAKPAGDIPIRGSYHEFTTMSVGVVGRHWAVAVSRVLLVEITRETNPDLLIASIRSDCAAKRK